MVVNLDKDGNPREGLGWDPISSCVEAYHRGEFLGHFGWSDEDALAAISRRKIELAHEVG